MGTAILLFLKKNPKISITIAIILLVVVIYFVGKLKGAAKKKEKDQFDIPITETDTIPDGYNPQVDVIRLKGAMEGWGTDESAIWAVLQGKTKGQLKAIYNTWNKQESENLFEWFKGDLSGDDLSRAMGYFEFILK